MGCHTWFYKKVDYPVDTIKDKAVKYLQEEIDSCKFYIEQDFTDGYVIKEDFENSLKYHQRVLDWVNKGWINEAAAKIVSFLDGVTYSNNTKCFYKDANYHDIFRRGGYPDHELHSLEETLQYLEKYDGEISYQSTIFDETPREELKNRAIERLKEFWEKYPDGMIDFG